jgi:uncharacterized protein (DUF433 family)
MTTVIEISALPMNDYLEQLEPDVVQVKGHRIGLEQIVERYQEGYSAEQIAQEFPGVELKAIYAIIAYYLHNQAAVDAYVARIDESAETRYREWAANMPEISRRMRGERGISRGKTMPALISAEETP